MKVHVAGLSSTLALGAPVWPSFVLEVFDSVVGRPLDCDVAARAYFFPGRGSIPT
jgi:hypothetical protein